MLFDGRNRVRYDYSRWGYTRGGGTVWHGGIDIEGLDSTTIRMPMYDNQVITGTVVTARIVTDQTNPTWEWGYYVCVQLDAGQTPDSVNFLYFCHNKENLVTPGTKVKSGDALAIMGNTGNAALANPPFEHCHFEVRNTATSKGLDPTHYAGFANEAGTYGTTDDLEYDEYTGMSYLIPGEYSGTYEYFYDTDVYTSAGSLIKNGTYRLLGISKTQKGGFTWAKILINGGVFYVALHDNYQAVRGPEFPSVLREGIDISKWQGVCDFDAIVQSGVSFVIMRVSVKDGSSCYMDSYFEQNYTNAKAAGLLVGLYFYTQAKTVDEMKEEIDFFLPHLAGKKIDLPIYIDIEQASVYSTMDKNFNTELVREGCEYLLQKGFYPGWYTYRTFATNYLVPESLAKYTFWLAETGVSTPKYKGPYEVWQYNQISGEGLVQSSALDVDKQYYDFTPYIISSRLNGYTEDIDITKNSEFFMNVKFSNGQDIDRGPLTFYLKNAFEVQASCVCNFENGYRASFGWFRVYGDDGLKRAYYITDETGNTENLPTIENYTLSGVTRNAPEFEATYLYNGDPEEKPTVEEISFARFCLTGGSSEEWSTFNPILKKNELVLDTTKKKFIVGNGKNKATELGFFGTDAETLEGHRYSEFAKSADIPKKLSELDMDLTLKPDNVGLGNVTNDKQMVGIAGEITPGNLLILSSDGYHVEDSGISIDEIKALLGKE